MFIEGIGSTFGFSDRRIQRASQESQINIDKTLERLSTGLRLNRSADDPSDFFLAKKTEGRLLSQSQAADNTRAGSLLLATAEGGVQSILEGLNRIRALTLESLTDTLSSSERNNLQEELKKIVAFIDEKARNTRFNGRTLLDGSAAGVRFAQPATAQAVVNQQVVDSTGGAGAFVRDFSLSQTDISQDSNLTFRLFDTGDPNNIGLEISSSTLGVITVTHDYAAFPKTHDIPVDGNGALLQVTLADLGLSNTGPLTLSEYQSTTLQELIDDRRIAPVSFGGLNLTLGGVTYNGVVNVQPNQTLEDVVNGLNGLAVSTGTLSASFDPGTSRISVSYQNQSTVSANTSTFYAPAVPTAAGGPFVSFAAMGGPGEGPAYRDIDPFLPGSPFVENALPPGQFFPTVPASLDTTLDFSGTDASILSALGLNSVADSGLVTDYTATYSGLTVATGNPSEYVNRTQVSIGSVSSENEVSGTDTGLTSADANTALGVLGIAKVDVTPFGAGDFSLDFGSNGIYTFAGFDPAVHTIQDIVDDINAYASTTGADVNASFDANTNELLIQNTPLPKVDDPGFVPGGEFFINFGFNGVFNSAFFLGGFDPNTQTIDDVVQAINDFGILNSVAVSASYDETTDRLTLRNQVPLGLGLNQIVIGGTNGAAFRDFFNVNSDFGGLLGSVTVTSTSDIDNSAVNADYDITAADVTGTPLAELSRPTGNNQILFGGPNGSNIQSFFKITDVPDSGTSVSQSAVSGQDISSQNIDPALDVTLADVSGSTLEELFTPKVTFSGGGVPSGALVLNGQTLINIDVNTTLNDIVNAINGASGPNNQSYTADFDTTVAGGLFIGVRDTETLSAATNTVAADPSGASPQVNGNQLTLDSAAFIAEQAPLSYNSGTPLGSGSGPAEQLTFQSTPLSPQYQVNAPNAAGANISGIQFSGSNLATVLGLQNQSSGSATLIAGSDQYRGTITYQGANTYQLLAEYQQTYGASSATSSSSAIGTYNATGQRPPLGVVAEIFIRASQNANTTDNALVFQTGIEEGQTYRVEIADLTASALGIESLNLVGADAQSTRQQGNAVLQRVDQAMEMALDVLAGLGSDQEILGFQANSLAYQKETMSAYLSDLQDADISVEIGNLTRSQINLQAASFALSENRRVQAGVLGSLLGDIRLLNY